MITQPLVSVVMPSLNQRAFIGQAIRSVLSQDYRALELIIADGGSTDGTLDLLQTVAAADPRLRWSSQSDSGPAEAINRALGQVRGTIIGWLNSDDLYADGAIGRAVAAFAANADWIMVYGHGDHVDAKGELLDRYPTQRPEGPIKRFADGCFICQPTVFFRRSMHVLLGDLDAGLKASFDFDYWLRAFTAFQERIGFIDALQARSRLHDACITRTARRTVAVEGVRVVARHLGEAPMHWIVTYVEGEMRKEVDENAKTNLRADVLDMLSEVGGCLSRVDLERLRGDLYRS